VRGSIKFDQLGECPLLPPRPVLRERVGVRVISNAKSLGARNHPHPNLLPDIPGEGTRRASGQVRSLVLFTVLLLAGCCPPPPQPAFYNGPLESMDQVVADINQNDADIPGFLAQFDFSATVVDKRRNKTDDFSGDGRLLFSRPQFLLLKAQKDLVGRIFEIGSNDSVFWFKVLVGDTAEWWGRYANLGKPCCKPIPIRPDLVLEVLGVSLFDTNFLNEPVPVMRFNHEADAYMFVWSVKGAHRWYARKEIWYDRVSKMPQLVRLYDKDGRVILQAKLSGHAPVEMKDQPPARWPRLARHYDLLFLEDGSRMIFDFDDATIRQSVPTSSFDRPTESETKEEIQIDKDCGDEAK
jgi:hypothetical protein